MENSEILDIMIDTEIWIKEKQSVRDMAADLIVAVLWTPNVFEASGDTALHHIYVWKDSDCIRAEIKKVR